ncbi:MAG: DUF1553 domain-containing protein [Planctomycetes bacterium]|nr:DUF1553 domain-containing protein [Planctomycetota bacterium]
MKDYYALSGYLQSSRFNFTCVDLPDARGRVIADLAKLRQDVHDLQSRLSASEAPATAQRVKGLLLGALDVLHPGADVVQEPQTAVIENVAKTRQLDPTELARWVAYLLGPARKNPAEPFHLWALLASVPGELSNVRVGTWSDEQRAGLTQQTQHVQAAESRYVVFDDFAKPELSGWFLSGDAFGKSTVEAGMEMRGFPFALSTQSWLGNRAVHSAAVSPRLEGTIRSQTFTIEKNHVLYHAGGRGAKINMIIDSFRLIQYPIYGGLTINLDTNEKLQWYVQDVSKWVGHNAYVELVDPGDGFVAIDRILFSDDGPPPDRVNPVSQVLLTQRDLNSPAQLAGAYETLWAEALAPETSRAAGDGRSPDLVPALAQIRKFLATHELATSLPVSVVSQSTETQEAIARWNKSRDELSAAIQYSRRAITMADGTPEDDFIHLRGTPHRLGEVVPRRLLEAIGGADQPVSKNGSGRLDLARRMIDVGHPVLARVLVNRIWKHHFGEGLVATPDDFGNMGQKPTHPELLDYLTAEFIQNGWSIKQLHRCLLLTQTYQMSSHAVDEARVAEIDPQNKLWHRMNMRRLECESLRDAVLAVSGRLNRQMYGPSVMPHLTAFMIGRGRPGQSGPIDGDGRRTIYLSVRRNFLTPMLLAFDYPIPFSTVGKRSVSNVPAQALALMNNPFFIQQAEVWATRLLAEQADPAGRVRSMYLQAFGRPASESEIQESLAFVDAQSQNYAADDRVHAWADLAHVLFNVKEFIFVE